VAGHKKIVGIETKVLHSGQFPLAQAFDFPMEGLI
jgi:hypothetical protein